MTPIGLFHELHDKPFFGSEREQDQLERNLKSLVLQGVIHEIPVSVPVGYGEQWYKEDSTGEIYRYVPPEFPAKGVWAKVIP